MPTYDIAFSTGMPTTFSLPALASSCEVLGRQVEGDVGVAALRGARAGCRAEGTSRTITRLDLGQRPRLPVVEADEDVSCPGFHDSSL